MVAGATLAIGAGLLAIVLDDSPLVDWLKRGPFGPEQDDAYSHLANNPQETYHRLVDLLARPRITIEEAHNMSARLANQGYAIDLNQDREFAKINTVVRVENNLAAMLDEASLTVAMRPVQITRKPTRRGLRTQRETLQEPPKVVLKQPLPNGQASRNLVFPTPELHDPSIGGGHMTATLDLTGYAPTAYRLPPTAYRRDCKASGPAEPSQQSTLFRKSWTMGPPLPKGKLSGVYPPNFLKTWGPKEVREDEENLRRFKAEAEAEAGGEPFNPVGWINGDSIHYATPPSSPRPVRRPGRPSLRFGVRLWWRV